ncbi:hypothetical protein EMPS_02848 [Entomortierella parvispora]|uniref:Uncharacterized protein n=1 Tax=Entomortierella parvispora TaxID=205924 RepID=A0A9P3H5H5_9FUNG|nr:hypothetical protein EMPS_02848 [Entomortierella parvispora]
MARRILTPRFVCFASTSSPCHPFFAAFTSLHSRTLPPWRPILHRSAFSSGQRSPSDKSPSLTPPKPTPPTSTSASPRLRIHSRSDKERNNAIWTAQDDDRLLHLRMQGLTWLQISQELGRSRQACNRRFNAVINPGHGTSFWIEDHVVDVDSQTRFSNRDQALRCLVERGFGWKAIANLFGNVKASACQERWRVVRKESVDLVAGNENTIEDETRQGHKGKAPWLSPVMTPSDQKLLRKSVQETYGEDQWDLLAKEVFDSAFSAEYLRIRYTKMERLRQVWTVEEDSELVKEVGHQQQQGSSSLSFKDDHGIPPESGSGSWMEALQEEASKRNWTLIASHIPGDHTGDECRKRWLKLTINRLRHSKDVDSLADIMDDKYVSLVLSKGPSKNNLKEKPERLVWTAEQSDRLEHIITSQLHSEPGQSSPSISESRTLLIDWFRVAKEMGGKFTPSQCKSRWNRMSFVVPVAKRSWQKDELLALARGLNSVGPSWAKIHRQFLPGRPPSFIQSKWVRIQTKLRDHMVIEQRSWKESCRRMYTGDLGSELGRLVEERPDLCKGRAT